MPTHGSDLGKSELTYGRDYSFGRRGRFFAEHGISPAVKWLVIANLCAFVLQALLERAYGWTPVMRTPPPWSLLMLHGADVFLRLHVWQLVTYMFLHGGVLHVGFNMLMLWMFGTSVEQAVGTRRFLWLYFLAGMVGGLCQGLIDLVDPAAGIIGASGGVFGVMVAFAMLFGEAIVLVFFFFPMKARYMVLVFVGINLLMLAGGEQGVAALAHLGGAAAGWAVIRFNLFSSRPRVRQPRQRKGIGKRIKSALRRVFLTEEPSPTTRTDGPVDYYEFTSADEAEREERAVDEILAKIAREGISTLTDTERDILERASERKRRQRKR